MTGFRLAVIGPIGVGKDTVCAEVVARLGLTARQVKIGGLVIADLDRALSDPDGGVPSDLKAQGLRSIRDLPDPVARRDWLRRWGALRRQADVGYWLSRLSAALDEAEYADLVYVCDARRDAEIELLRARSYLIAQLHASPRECASRAASREGRPLPDRTWTDDEWEFRPDRHPLADVLVHNENLPAAAADEIVAILQSRLSPVTKGYR